MCTYLFYTTEGYCEAPDRRVIDNCQMLGRAEGVTREEALQHLLEENSWIREHGYDPKAIIACQVVE